MPISNWNRHLRTEIKSQMRKYLGTDFNLDGVKIDKDYQDQAKLLSLPVKTIFDIGSNAGQTTFKYRKLFPDATIYAFEPNRNIFRKYCKMFSWDDKVMPNNFAIADKNGQSKYYLNQCHYTNSLLKTEKFGDRYFHDNDSQLTNLKQTVVQTVTLDTFVKKNNIQEIDILKMDIQGGELKALQGAREIIKQKMVRLFFLEIEFIKIYSRQPLLYDIWRFLDERNYTLFNVYGIGSSTAGQAITGDAIFISPQVRKEVNRDYNKSK